MEANELIERYIHEVGRHLPRSTRSDIQMELRSLLLDSLEERAAAQGKAPTVKMAADLLQEFGKPKAIAAQYRPEQYLIGPRLFTAYKQVMTVALVIISVIHVAGLVFTLLRGETAVWGQAIWGWFSNFFNVALVNAGIITLIFIGLERAQIADLHKAAEKDAAWDPLELPPAEDRNRINRCELGFEMLWTVAFLILFNFYPQWIGIVTNPEGETAVFRLLAPAFAVHIPWLTLLWTLELMLKSVALVQGRWTYLTRWLELGLVPLNVYVLNRIRTGGEIFTISGLTVLLKLVLALVIVIVVLDGLYKLYRLLWQRPLLLKSRLA